MIDDGTVAVRLLLAAALGAAVGLEREWRNQPAGLRTHLLVSLGACLFTLMSAFGFSSFIGGSAKQAASASVSTQVDCGVLEASRINVVPGAVPVASR